MELTFGKMSETRNMEEYKYLVKYSYEVNDRISPFRAKAEFYVKDETSLYNFVDAIIKDDNPSKYIIEQVYSCTFSPISERYVETLLAAEREFRKEDEERSRIKHLKELARKTFSKEDLELLGLKYE